MIDPRTFYNFADAPLYIGYHGENLVTGVDIDLAGVLPDGWGAGLLLRRPGEGREAEYEAVSALEGSTLRATFETYDTMIEGRGEATIELRGPNGKKKKSDTAQTVIPHALDLNGTPPDRPEQYRTAAQQDVIDAGKLSKAAQAEKTEEMTQPVGVDADGKLWVPPGGGGGSSDELWRPMVDSAGNISWQKSTSSTPPTTQNIKGQPGAAGRDGTDGQDGRDGTDGEDGFSPAVTVAQITGGHRVNITDKTHLSGQSFDVLDGEDGAQGAPGTPGAPGADGITPTIGNNGNWFLGSTDTGKPSRGEQGIQGIQGIPGTNGADGQDGADGKSAYASAQDGGYTGTESQFNTDLAAVSGKYSKPSSGIPKTDLASAVQTSLGRADSALQEHLLYKCVYGVTAYADVVAAINAGKIPYVLFANHFFVYGKYQDNEVSFTVAVGVYAYKMQVKASGWSYVGSVYATTDDLTAYRTASAQDVIDATKADKPTVKTTMDSVATVNTQYFLGAQSAVSITLPSNAAVGSQISAVWYNGTTAATLTIQGSSGAPVLDPGYSPSANSRSEINALWDGTYWAVVTNEQAVTP